jgi:hypothetical protein
MTTENYAVIPAPGYHGDWVSVYATFPTIRKARNFARTGGCRILKGCDEPKGAKIGRGIVQDMINSGHWHVVS